MSRKGRRSRRLLKVLPNDVNSWRRISTFRQRLDVRTRGTKRHRNRFLTSQKEVVVMAKGMIVSRRFLLASCLLAPVIPLALSYKPDPKKRENILKRLAINTWTWRIFRGMSLESVAARCGYEKELQREIEKGKHNITLARLEHLANGLETSAYHLLRRP